jgi:hypothetical protein
MYSLDCYSWSQAKEVLQSVELSLRTLQANRKLSHVVLLILLAGNVATNPGPTNYLNV